MFLEHVSHEGQKRVTLGRWQEVLITSRFGDGSLPDAHLQDAAARWRAYQVRECLSVGLQAPWIALVDVVDSFAGTHRDEAVAAIVDGAQWEAAGVDPAAAVGGQVPVLSDADSAVELLTMARHVWDGTRPIGERVAVGVILAASASRHATSEAARDLAFADVCTSNAPERWSLPGSARWFSEREGATPPQLLEALLLELLDTHEEVALEKVVPGGSRDPFCLVAGDDGVFRRQRDDELFWMEGRFGPLRHLLWTLGLLTENSDSATVTVAGAGVLALIRRELTVAS